MIKGYDIVGYTFNGDNYTPGGIIEELIGRNIASPGSRGMDVEDALHQIASANAIDWEDERSFDSNDFPKVIFYSQLEDSEMFIDENGDYVSV